MQNSAPAVPTVESAAAAKTTEVTAIVAAARETAEVTAAVAGG